MGAPRLYFFDSETITFVDEIESMERDRFDPAKLAKGCDDHAIDTGKYWASDDPRYFGDNWFNRNDGYEGGTPYTNA